MRDHSSTATKVGEIRGKQSSSPPPGSTEHSIHGSIGLRDRLAHQEGFTLIEHLVVIVIIAILAAIAVPA